MGEDETCPHISILLKPLAEGLSEQNKQLQGASLISMAKVFVVVTKNSEQHVEAVERIAVRLLKLWKTPSFLARACLLQTLSIFLDSWTNPMEKLIGECAIVAYEGAKNKDWTVRKAALHLSSSISRC